MKSFSQDEGVINLRDDDSAEEDAEFRISHIDDEEEPSKHSEPSFQKVGHDAVNTSTMVKLKFDKFVTLIASRDSEDVFDKHMDEDVIISAELLTDLASTADVKEGNKTPFIFLVGILLGIAVTWILLKT